MNDALAVVANAILFRSATLNDLPFYVDGQLYAEAEMEMEARMRDRGFPIPRSPSLRKEHFLLNGVVIAPNG